MDAQTDAQLLRAYAEHRADAAFAELVRRHLDLVHSAARRMVGDAHLAEDVTQATFLALAKNAAQLTERPVLAGWLHRTAQNIAAQTVRTDVRRRAREQEAAAMNELLADSGTVAPPAWSEIAPHLDAALGELSEPERDAVLLRYFQRQSAREMAQTLGISDEAAQKRVSRAVDRLREFFAKRGVTVGASGLVVVISANAVQAAPVGLALTITTAAALTGTALVTTATVTATKAIIMTAIQKTVIAATIAVLAGAVIYETRQASQLREQVQAFQQQQTQLAEQIQQLGRERDEATSRTAALGAELASIKNNNELLRLRGEVTRLRINVRELEQSRTGIEITTNDVFGATAAAWAKTANSFKQWFEQNPDKSIPELQLLTEADWLFEARRNLQVFTNRSQGNDIHMIADSLRTTAKSRFANMLSHALSGYIASNAGSLPDDLSQLLPYFAPVSDTSSFARSVDPSILQRYELLQTGQISDVQQGGPIVREKAPVDDVIDAILSMGVGSYSMQSTGKVNDEMRQGQPTSWSPQDIERIRPFLK
jgi:RNA polymerase sigma factor (sigma-70 family)